MGGRWRCDVASKRPNRLTRLAPAPALPPFASFCPFVPFAKCNVAGIVLAGSADFKTELGQSDMFDGRLAAKVLKVVDVSYGGENGFNQAIELASETLGNVNGESGAGKSTRGSFIGNWSDPDTAKPVDGTYSNNQFCKEIEMKFTQD